MECDSWVHAVGFIKSVVASQERITYNIDFHCKRCLEGSPEQLGRAYDNSGSFRVFWVHMAVFKTCVEKS